MRPRAAAVRRVLSRAYRSEPADRVRSAVEPLVEGWIRLDRTRRRRCRPRARHVLFVADTPMMLDQALEVWELLVDRPDTTGHVTVPRRFRADARRLALERHLTFRRSPLLSRLRWWDLVVTANHVAPYPRNVPTARLQHGMDGVGKVLHGQGFTYGARRVLRRDGSPVYTRILESSERVRRHVVGRLPQLAESIVVVGNLTADRVAALEAQRSELRDRIPGDGPVVAIMSTFGMHSLMETMGLRLLPELVRLRHEGRYRFVICSHPNLWARQGKLARPWDDRLLALERHGIVVARPGDDWRALIVTADVAVSDHTSVCIPYARSGRPLVTVPPPTGVLLEESTVGLLHRATPTLEDPVALDRTLRRALEEGLTAEARAVADAAVSCPGEAAVRIRSALIGLLDR